MGVGGRCSLVYAERSTTPCRLGRLRDNEGIVMTFVSETDLWGSYDTPLLR